MTDAFVPPEMGTLTTPAKITSSQTRSPPTFADAIETTLPGTGYKSHYVGKKRFMTRPRGRLSNMAFIHCDILTSAITPHWEHQQQLYNATPDTAARR